MCTLNSKKALHDAWISLAEPYPWEWFVTLTFAQCVHPEAALKYFRRFVNKLNTELYGRRWHKELHGGIMWLVALERQSNNNPHLHALMLGTHSLRRLSKMDEWEQLALSTGFARIEKVKYQSESIAYVTKYVTKDGEIDVSKNFGDRQKLEILLKHDQLEL